ncbi:MAG TPA: hypothetical protein VK432_03580 [Stellaceae bacterium]|nr:hypothetical protein [Stellaceae bacterium]
MARYGCFAIGWLLLAAVPAAAQSNDPFREATPPQPQPVAPAPLPPRPRPAPEPEPVVAPAPPPQPAVAPVSTLPSAAQIWARVREVAQAESIAVPLASSPPFDQAGTPAQFRALLGAWGPGTWQGGSAGEKMVLVIQSVDSDGAMHGVVGKSAGPPFPAAWSMATGTTGTGRFVLKGIFLGSNPPGANNLVASRPLEFAWAFEFRADGKLYGSRDNGASTVVLARLQ